MTKIILLITFLFFTISQPNAKINIEENKHHLTDLELQKLRSLAVQGKIVEGWEMLSSIGDPYATSARSVISPNTEWGSFISRLVRTHWIHSLGEKAYKQNFQSVARQHFSQYVHLLSNGYFPNSKEICISYRKAILDHHLSPMSIFDGVWIHAGFDTFLRWEFLVNLPTNRWENSDIFHKAEIDNNQARKILLTDFLEVLSGNIPPLADGEKDIIL